MVIDDDFKKDFLRIFRQCVETTLVPRIKLIKEDLSKEFKSMTKSSILPSRKLNTSKRDYARIADGMTDLRTRIRRLEDVVFKIDPY